MASQGLRSEERIGLIVAVVLHVALLAVLLIRLPHKPIPAPERIVVTLSDDVGLTSTSPEPNAQAAPDVAPQLGEPAPAEPELLPETPPDQPLATPEPQPVAQPSPRPVPKPVAKPVTRPKPKPAPRPSPSAKPSAKPNARPAAKPASRPAAKPAAKPASNPGGSRIGENFLEGTPGGQSAGTSSNPPAATIGPAVRSALASALSRQLKPHWAAPQGPDVDKIVTILSFNLNRDGSLAGKPVVEDQRGINDVNRAQAYRHAEQAIRAVELAAPFDLPPQYYDAWKRVSSFRFDRRLSQ